MEGEQPKLLHNPQFVAMARGHLLGRIRALDEWVQPAVRTATTNRPELDASLCYQAMPEAQQTGTDFGFDQRRWSGALISGRN